MTYLNRGGLPAVYPSADYAEELWAYTALYLKEEIRNEALTRKVAQFSEFLYLMALSNGEEISYQSIAGDCGVSPNSIKNYIQILEDTLVAFQLKAFTKTRKRKAISRSKLYFFDVGVTNSLAKRGEIRDWTRLFCRRDGKVFNSSSEGKSSWPSLALIPTMLHSALLRPKGRYGLLYSDFGACQLNLFLGQMDGECTPRPEGALHRYAAAVGLGDVFDDGEPKAGAA